MRTERIDPHRPGAIIPSDYRFVIDFAILRGTSPLVRYNVERAREIAQTGRAFHRNGRGFSLFNCSVCGANYDAGELWIHEPSQELIVVGHDCADKYNMLSDRSEWLAWHKEQTRLKSQAAKDKRFKIAALRFLEERPGFAEVLGLDHPILRDMALRLNKWGQLSEKQVSFALKLAAEVRNPRPAEPHVPAPTGRVTFSGEIVSVKQHESDWGTLTKITVKVTTPEGSWLAWLTMPAGFPHGAGRGALIEVTATLTQGRDPYFAFGKRPRLVPVKEAAVA